MSVTIGTKKETRIIISPEGMHDEHEVIYDNPAEGYIFDVCHQRYTTIKDFYESYGTRPREYNWKDIRELTSQRL